MKRIVLFSMLALVTAACLGSDFADSLQGSWELASGTVDGEEIPLLDSHPITIQFDGDQVRGTAACNTYFGGYEVSRSRISFDALALTEMGCFPDQVMRAEAMYADAISRVESVSLDGDLTLSGEGVELVFDASDPAPDAELNGTVWALDSLVRGDSVSTPVSGSRATIEFFSDGSVLGDTGCRPFSGQYTVSGREVVVTEITADGHECEPGYADQDQHFLDAIGDGFRVDIDGRRLTVWGRGDIGLVFISEP